MSLMRIQHVRFEIRKLRAVIDNLKTNYQKDFEEYDRNLERTQKPLNCRDEKTSLQQQNKTETKNHRHIQTLENLKSLAAFQSELMLVKHVALIENMIIKIFWCLTQLLHKAELEKTHFRNGENFSDCYKAANIIRDLTEGKVNFKKTKFWPLYETLKTIRNSIAHGEPGFFLSYQKAEKLNKEINIIDLLSEKNECEQTKHIYPFLIHSTGSKNSQWLCSLRNDFGALLELNKKCLQFAEETKEIYLIYGRENNFSTDDLYGCRKEQAWF